MVITVIQEALTRSIYTVVILAVIILPIMIFLEYISYFNLLERISSRFEPLTRCLALPPEAALPLLVGLFAGIFYGAAVIIEYSRRGLLEKRDLMLVGLFLALNHGIIEDNLLFAAMGANLLVLFVMRFAMAFIVTRIAAFCLDRKGKN